MAELDDLLAPYAETRGSASGSWDEPPPKPAWDIEAYLKSLPARALEAMRVHGEGIAKNPDKIGEAPILGPLVKSYRNAREGDWLPAVGRGVEGLADVFGASRAGRIAKSVGASDAALWAWNAAREARPGQLTERAAQELAQLRPAKFKAGTKADEARIAKARWAAERGIPEPVAPSGFTTEGAQKALDVASRTWPGNIIAGTVGGSAASGIPGVVLDDIKGVTIDPLNAMRKEMADENRSEKDSRTMPITEGAEPEVRNYWGQVDQLRHERNKHAAMAGGLFAAGAPTTYGAIKTVPWALKTAPLGLAGLGLEAGKIHPGLALPFLAAAALPLAVPGGLGWGGWELSKASSGQIDQAMNKHAEASELARIVRKLLENYRDQPDAPSLTPDQAY